MNKLTGFLEKFFLLAPEGDGAGGDSTGGDSTTTTTTTTEPEVKPEETKPEAKPLTEAEKIKNSFDLGDANTKKASFVSQLSKENQDIDFGENITKIDDLVADWQSLKKGNERAINIPTKESSPEEIKAFLKQMNVPDKPEDYEMEQGTLSDAQYNDVKDIFMKEAFNTALSRTQAKKMWTMINSHFTAQNEMIKEMNNNVAETFDARFDKELESISTDSSIRKTKAKEYINLYKDLVTKDPSCAVFKEFGLNLNPKVIIALGGLNKRLGGDSFTPSNHNSDSANKSPFGASFNNTYKK